MVFGANSLRGVTTSCVFWLGLLPGLCNGFSVLFCGVFQGFRSVQAFLTGVGRGSKRFAGETDDEELGAPAGTLVAGVKTDIKGLEFIVEAIVSLAEDPVVELGSCS